MRLADPTDPWRLPDSLSVLDCAAVLKAALGWPFHGWRPKSANPMSVDLLIRVQRPVLVPQASRSARPRAPAREPGSSTAP